MNNKKIIFGTHEVILQDSCKMFANQCQKKFKPTTQNSSIHSMNVFIWLLKKKFKYSLIKDPSELVHWNK